MENHLLGKEDNSNEVLEKPYTDGESGSIYCQNVNGEIIPVEMTEDMISKLLLNNQIGIKGHIETFDNDIPHIFCDKLTILDRRGKKNGN